MRKVQVSILVPIYNVERYLEKCLESIIRQSLRNIEIICINDGSSDKSLDIIEKYASIDDRIIIIDKENTGYGDSMNHGLEAAQGEYIGIVESDDYVEQNMFERLYSLAKQYDADIVKSNFNFYWDSPEKKIYVNNLRINSIVNDNETAREHIFWGLPAIWSAIYRKKLLDKNNIRFLSTPGASYQDTSFHFKTNSVAKNIIITPEAYLNYRQDNSSSSVKNADISKAYLLHKEWGQIEKFLQEHNIYKKYCIFCHTLKFNGYMWNYKRISSKDKKVYFNEIHAIAKEDKCMIDFNHIPKYCKFGGFFAVEHRIKCLLDSILCLRRIIKNDN